MSCVARIFIVAQLFGLFFSGCRTSSQNIEIPAVSYRDVDFAIANSLESARKRLLSNRDSGDAWGEYGMVFFAHDFKPEADICFQEAAKRSPADSRWPYLRALSIRRSAPERAQQMLEEGLQANENAPPILRMLLAEIYLESGNLEAARKNLAQLENSSEMAPRVAHANARLFFLKGDYQKCHDEIVGFLKTMEQSYSRAQQRVAEATKQGRKNEAAKILAAANAQLDQQQRKQKTLGLLLAASMRQLGDAASAERQSKHAENLPDRAWPDLFMKQVLQHRTGKKNDLNRADVAFGNGDYGESISILQNVIRLYPDEPYAYLFLGRALNRKGSLARQAKQPTIALEQYSAAVDALNKGRELSPNSVDAVFRLAFAKSSIAAINNDKSLLKEVEVLYREAVQRKPDFTRAWFNLGDCLHKQGKSKKAIESLQKAAQLEPNDSSTQLALGVLFYESREISKARKHLEDAVRISPNNSAARSLLSKIK